MLDLITIGDTVIDTFVPLESAEVKLINGERKLLLNFDDKVPVGPSTSFIGGNSANSAVGATRLNLKTAVYTNIGDDPDDLRVLSKFKEEGVETKYIKRDKELGTNHHIVLDFDGGRTILSYHQPYNYQLPDLEKSKWVYFSSLASSFTKSDIVAGLINYLERANSKLLYNPGTFQIKHGVKKYPRLLSLVEVFIVNLEEAKLVLGHGEGEKVPIKKLLQGLADLGPRLVIITNGADGSYGFDGKKFFSIGVFPHKLVEITGAGDGYATGVLAGLFYGNSLEEAMRWGAANGASVVEQIGPQAGLLTYDQMLEKLKQNSKIVAKEI